MVQQEHDPKKSRIKFPLLLDEPSEIDLLSFDAVAGTVVEAMLDERLDPIALGLSGSWGSGKTSVLRLIAKQLQPDEGEQKSRLVIETDPWRYDPQFGTKESLIGEILSAIESEIPEDSTGDKAKSLLSRLSRRVDWGKALQVAAKSAITVSLPSIDSIFELIKPKEGAAAVEPITDMVEFRAEFKNLLESEGLEHISNVIVLVDDLDRCLPETVVETLETIRLFLAVPKMSFVIAADEERVAEAIAAHFPQTNEASTGEESPSRLYLHKIVQTSVPVPALSDFDTEAYLVLLQIQQAVDPDDYQKIVDEVADARRAGTSLDEVSSLLSADFTDARNNAARIKPIVHEKTKGNPRRIKRFLNDLSVRLGIASRRGIELDAATIAKLMVLEQYFPDEFKEVTGWLNEHTLRANLRELEVQAGTPKSEDEPDEDVIAETAEPDLAKPASGRKALSEPAAKPKPPFKEGLLRWARLSPSLAKKDIASYLVFAASFKNIFLTAGGLPERLRDLATNLLSKSIKDNSSVTREMLESLPTADAEQLIAHIGGVVIDQPERQTPGVTGLIRIARYRGDSVMAVVNALKRIPAVELKPGGLMQLEKGDPPALFSQFEVMAKTSKNNGIAQALSIARGED